MHTDRPYQKEGASWPDQLLCKGVGLAALQRQLSDPAGATGQLVKMMRQRVELSHIPPPANALVPPTNLSIQRNWDFVKASSPAVTPWGRSHVSCGEPCAAEAVLRAPHLKSREPAEKDRKYLRVPSRCCHPRYRQIFSREVWGNCITLNSPKMGMREAKIHCFCESICSI